MSRRLTDAERLVRTIPEADLQRTMEEALTVQGWLWFHDRSLAHTQVRATNPGFPDLCAVHPATGVLIFLELKRETGKLRPEQRRWGQALVDSPAIYAVVRPSDADRVIARLATLARVPFQAPRSPFQGLPDADVGDTP